MKKPIFIILLIFTLFITACGGGPLGGLGTSSKPEVSDVNIYVGTQALSAEFGKGAPPPRVFESSSFPILLRIRNVGAYSITSDRQEFGVLSIGREKDYVPSLSLEKNNRVSSGSTDNEVFFNIDGKTKINQKGDEVIVSVNAKTGKLDSQSEYKISTITATLCHPYKTTLSTTVCIDTDVAGIRPGKKVCNVKELVFANGQGAPIAVTKIEPQMIPEGDKIKPQFLIFIENKGRGNSVDKESYRNVCGRFDFGEEEDTDKKEEIGNIWNVAALRAYTSGKETPDKPGIQLVCCPNLEGQCDEKETDTNKMTGFIRFRDRKDFVRCIFKDKEAVDRSSDAFTSPLRIEIDYGYIQTISTNFVIQKPLKY